MSGHSKWAKIHRTKAVEDAKRGAVFTRLGNAIAVAAKHGTDPDMNFALRLAIDKAKASNMPANNIQRAIDRGSGKLGGQQIQEVMYEGYGPNGVGILVECATDNTNRTYTFVRTAFTKNGGSTAEKGSVAFLFDRKGVIRVKSKISEEVLLKILDAGAEDTQEDEAETIIYTDQKQLANVRQNLQELGVDIIEAELAYIPRSTITISDEVSQNKIIKLLDALDELDDVVTTHTNFDI